ncbi:MAG: FHA domain-containing protein [Marivita sp.]|uniref:FHA domain-containing protein n=1 Tax=Marivita sp. TaxID=2003365 RepID=UPI003EF79482
MKREFYLNGTSFTIGRDFASDICLPDLSKTISQTHLVVRKMATGSYSVNDTSASGATMNGRLLPPKEPQSLKDGDIVGLAGYKLLFGIVEAVLEEEPVQYFPKQKFVVETDMSANAPLLPDEAIEEVAQDPDRGFSAAEMDLDPDLMFDPFADGPVMREPPKPKQRANPAAAKTSFNDPVEIMDLAQYQAPAAFQDAHLRASHYREQVSKAMEHALDRFLQELDPATLQDDYDDYIPRLANRQKRYWQIHSRQFAKKKAGGEFRRTFMALFAEEMRKL